MHSIQEREIHRTVKLLSAMNCQFLIIDPDGNHHGDLKIAEPRKRQPRKYEYGVVKQYVTSLINMSAEIGDVQILDPKEFEAEAVRSSVCNLLTEVWGKDTYTTHINKQRHVEIMRMS